MQFVVRVGEGDELPNHEGMKEKKPAADVDAGLWRASSLGQV